MQDDFKIPTPPSDNVPATPSEPSTPSEPALPEFGLEQTTPPAAPVSPAPEVSPSLTPTPPEPVSQPVSTTDFSLPVEPAGQDTPSNDSPFPTEPVMPPTDTPMQSSLPPLVPSDPGPIPPATSMNIPSSPQVHGPVFGGPDGVVTPAAVPSAGGPAKIKKPMLLAMIAAVVVVLLGLTYVFAFYLPNTPTNVFKSSLSNTGIALDRLITYSQQQQHAQYTSFSFNGTTNEKSPTGSYDITSSGAVDKNDNLNFQLNADLMGVKVSANVLGLKAAGNTTPDFYVQVNGVKNTLDSLGLNKYDYLDGQWILIDHTLIDTYASVYQQALGTNSSKSGSLPTYADVMDAVTKVQMVNKDYLFTTDAAKAVFVNQQFLGKEISGGQSLDHYRMGYNKAHLNAYAAAVGQALDSSSLNTWYKGVSSGKNLSQELNISSLQSKINSASGNYTFDMWANTKTKLVAKVSFNNPSDKSTVFSVSQSYNGGTTYPISFGLTGKDSSGNAEAANLTLSLDTSTNKANLTFSDNTSSPSGMTNVSGNMSFAPSNKPVQVTAPKNAKSLSDILVSLGLGALTQGSSSASSLLGGTTSDSSLTLPTNYSVGNTQ